MFVELIFLGGNSPFETAMWLVVRFRSFEGHLVALNPKHPLIYGMYAPATYMVVSQNRETPI